MDKDSNSKISDRRGIMHPVGPMLQAVIDEIQDVLLDAANDVIAAGGVVQNAVENFVNRVEDALENIPDHDLLSFITLERILDDETINFRPIGQQQTGTVIPERFITELYERFMINRTDDFHNRPPVHAFIEHLERFLLPRNHDVAIRVAEAYVSLFEGIEGQRDIYRQVERVFLTHLVLLPDDFEQNCNVPEAESEGEMDVDDVSIVAEDEFDQESDDLTQAGSDQELEVGSPQGEALNQNEQENGHARGGSSSPSSKRPRVD